MIFGWFFKEKCFVLAAMFFVAPVFFSVDSVLALNDYCYFTVLEKASNGKLACVKEHAAKKLIERGWGMPYEGTQEHPQILHKAGLVQFRPDVQNLPHHCP